MMQVVSRHAGLAQLTSLRFFAALLVAVSHLAFLEETRSPALSTVYQLFFRQGGCGVTFFFVLSGFILTHAYGRVLQEGAISVTAYLYRRAARIFPLHLATGIAVMLFLNWRGDTPALSTVLLNLTLLHSWSPELQVHYSLNSPSWSLSNELFFYTLFPWLVKLPEPMLRRIFLAGMALIALSTGAIAVIYGGYSPLLDWLFYVFPPTRLFEFIAGILLYRAWQHGFGQPLAGTGAEIATVAVLLAVMAGVDWFWVPLVLRYQVIYLLPMAALVLIFAHGKGALSRWLHHPVLQLLGEASFAFYLIHRPIMIFMARWGGRSGAADLALAATMLLIGLAASVATYLLLDRPLERWLRRRAPASAARPLSA